MLGRFLRNVDNNYSTCVSYKFWVINHELLQNGCLFPEEVGFKAISLELCSVNLICDSGTLYIYLTLMDEIVFLVT